MGAPAAPPPYTETELARSERVDRKLRAAADPSGFLTFERFMDIALYGGEDGYYTRPDLRRGRGGDFYTPAHVTPVFGATVARRAASELARIGPNRGFRIVEVGAGDGTLSEDFAAAWSRAPDRPPIEYVRIEASGTPGPRGAEEQRGSVRLRNLPSLASEGPFVGVVIALELLDALPFRRVVRRGDGWHELGVRRTMDRWRWAESEEPAGLPVEPGPPSPEGTIREFSPATEAWIRELSDHLVDGAAVLIDYGEERTQLLRRHPEGTLAALRGHRPVPDPLERPGTTDLSCFVDFTGLRAAAGRAGFGEVAYRPLAETLGDWGIEEERDRAIRAAAGPEEEVRSRLAVKNLLFGFPTFRCLELSPRPDRNIVR